MKSNVYHHIYPLVSCFEPVFLLFTSVFQPSRRDEYVNSKTIDRFKILIRLIYAFIEKKHQIHIFIRDKRIVWRKIKKEIFEMRIDKFNLQ